MTCLALGFSTLSARAFSLLGPFQPWMEYTNGLRQPGDIGGPMCISNGYRWNVPVVTYGFDQSFLDYFGTNGVAAVKSAIQILNNLPPASQIALSNYPPESQHINYAVQAQNLYDLKSETLSLLLEQMGLAQPTRYIYLLKGWNSSLFNYQSQSGPTLVYIETNGDESDPNGMDPGGYLLNFVAERNFDPETLIWSPRVNDTLYDGEVYSFVIGQSDAIPFAVDPSADTYTAVADNGLGLGGFYTGLTYDDVGGLAYLLSTNNINYETLLPGVYGVGTNANSFVNGAWRPGVDKIMFVPQPVDSLTCAFLPMTNQFTDTYITNGSTVQQQLARVTFQPDFLFSVADTGKGNFLTPWLIRTGTTNWINNASLNGNSTGAGPGVIQPQIQIIFNKLGQQFVSGGNDDEIADDMPEFWGSYDASTNVPIMYPMPPQTGTNQMTLRMWLLTGAYPYPFKQSFDWSLAAPAGAQFLFQTSTDLTSWVSLFTNSNDGTITTFSVYNPASHSRFYRLVPQ